MRPSLLSSALMGVALALPAVPVSALTIDNFTVDQVLSNSGTGTAKSASTGSASNIVGGEREIVNTITSNPSNNFLDIIANGGDNDEYYQKQGKEVVGSSEVIRDGSDNTVGSNDNGLGGVDFTGGGDFSGLDVVVPFDDPSVDIEFTFTLSGGGSTASTLSLPGNLNSPQSFFLA
ncbi:hypothetical protein [Thiohalorhabdus sp.]|uniref:hypothetical protein n=1 Tax=Thiohalorhabdus sp. TaxID=3094134 RepID=UPI002FC27C31